METGKSAKIRTEDTMISEHQQWSAQVHFQVLPAASGFNNFKAFIDNLRTVTRDRPCQ
jgi:hypothetical protein